MADVYNILVVRHSRGEYAFLIRVLAIKAPADLPAAQNHHPVAHPHQLGQFARNQYHRLALRGQVIDQLVDLNFRADINPPRRLVEQNHLRLGHQRLAEHHLLLVAAGQTPHDRLLTIGPDSERIEKDLIAAYFAILVDQQSRVELA